MNDFQERLRPWLRYASLLLLLSLALSACQGASPDTKEPLRVGMECAYAPWNWTQLDDSHGAVPIANGSEYANGYDVAIAKAIAEHLERPLEIVKTDWDGLPPGVISGKLDLIIAGMSPTEERKKSIAFSDPYYLSDLVLVVQKDGPYAKATSLADFAGASITAQQNTVHYTVLDQIPEIDKREAMDSFPSLRVALMAGKIDAYVSERPEGISAAQALDSLAWLSPKEGFDVRDEDVQIAIGLKQDSPLLAPVNAALARLSQADRDALMGEAIAQQPQNED